MNKIFEVVEAQKLFNIPFHKIDIIIHPNSLVHALVELKNGLFESIYHETSMVIPIANAIFDGADSLVQIAKFQERSLRRRNDALDLVEKIREEVEADDEKPEPAKPEENLSAIPPVAKANNEEELQANEEASWSSVRPLYLGEESDVRTGNTEDEDEGN